MRSPTPWAFRPTRSLLVALPLLALLLLAPSRALACEGTAAEKVYCLAPAGIESGGSTKEAEKTQTKHHHTTPNTHHSTPSSTGEEPTETTTEPEPSGEGHHSKVAPAAKGGNHPGGGKPADQAAPKHHGDHVGPAKIVAPKSSEGPTTKGVPAAASSGGSSPVLPILVAIVILAAISIAIVVVRERKGGGGKAGYTGARG